MSKAVELTNAQLERKLAKWEEGKNIAYVSATRRFVFGLPEGPFFHKELEVLADNADFGVSPQSQRVYNSAINNFLRGLEG